MKEKFKNGRESKKEREHVHKKPSFSGPNLLLLEQKKKNKDKKTTNKQKEKQRWLSLTYRLRIQYEWLCQCIDPGFAVSIDVFMLSSIRHFVSADTNNV